MELTILVAGDLHGSPKALTHLPQLAREKGANLVILCGDITHMGKPKNYIARLAGGFQIPVFAIPGNCDPPQAFENECKQVGFTCLHRQRREVEGIPMVGFGGAPPHFWGGVLQVTERDIVSQVEPLMERGCILVVHCPPYGILDRLSWGKHAGSRVVLELVQKYEPKLVVSGHVHEARGVVYQNHTTFLNPGPAKSGYAAVVKVGNEVAVELIARRG